jgi:hypothetical protein
VKAAAPARKAPAAKKAAPVAAPAPALAPAPAPAGKKTQGAKTSLSPSAAWPFPTGEKP